MNPQGGAPKRRRFHAEAGSGGVCEGRPQPLSKRRDVVMYRATPEQKSLDETVALRSRIIASSNEKHCLPTARFPGAAPARREPPVSTCDRALGFDLDVASDQFDEWCDTGVRITRRDTSCGADAVCTQQLLRPESPQKSKTTA